MNIRRGRAREPGLRDRRWTQVRGLGHPPCHAATLLTGDP